MKPLYPRLLAYCLPYRRGLAASLVCMVFAAGLGTVPPWLLKNVVDDVLIAKRGDLLNSLAFGIVGLYVLKALFSYGQTYLMTWVGQRVVMDIRISLYDRIQRLSFSFFHRRRIGELLSRVTNDTTTVQDILVNVVVDLVVQGTTFLGILGFLLFLNWRLTLATFAIIPLAALVIDRTSKRLRDVGRSIQERLAGVSAVAQEALASIRIVRSFATEEEESARFRERNGEHFGALMRGARIKGILEGLVEVVLMIALCFILWLGGRDVIAGRLTVGALIAFLTYLGLLVQPIRVLSRAVGRIQQGLASAERIFEILDEGDEVLPPKDPIILSPARGEIRFEGVRFSYEPGRPVLENLDLRIAPGERLAVVGATGAGKSTLADLIPRFYDPQEGRIRADGTDLRRLDLKSWRRQIGIVPQEPILMKGTLRENIAYGCPAASPEAIREAARVADILEFVDSLPRGFDTEVAERGVTLSGGQRQRIAIARAIVRDPRLLILDEATSSLDLEAERAVRLAMRNASRGRTTLVIAHRLATVRDADRIVVLEGGRVVEEGTHEALLRSGGRYARLWSIQGGGADGNA
jgi:subfamily B ATP-binding cassette protein MsbA